MGSINERKHAEIQIADFSGGYAGAKAIGNMRLNEASDLDNIVILPGGSGFRNRRGNDLLLFSDLDEDNQDQVLGLFRIRVGTRDMLMRFTLNDNLSNEVTIRAADLDDNTVAGSTSEYATASYTITSNDVFMLSSFENGVIAVPDQHIPFLHVYISGADPEALTASLGAGTSPDGKVGTVWNNRVWIGNLAGDPSKLQYSILLASGTLPYAETTWTGAGSGFVNPDSGDGDELISLSPISNNVLLFFKKNSVHQVVGRSDPFAVFNLFEGIGCAGRHALVNVDGVVYFMTPDRRMAVTDGKDVKTDKDIPEFGYADDLWASVVASRYKYTYGFRHSGEDFDWIVWLVTTTGTTHNAAIIWDLRNKCWLRCSTGFNGNCATYLPDRAAYLGANVDGLIFQLNASGKYDDDSGGTAVFNGSGVLTGITGEVSVAWKWRSDDYAVSLHNITQIKTVNVLANYSASGALDLNYRYDGRADSSDISKTLVPTSVALNMAVYRPLGRGDTFGFELNSNSEVASTISKVTIVGSQQGSKDPGTV